MKSILFLLAAALPSLAQESAKPDSPKGLQATYESISQVRVDVLMVSVPEAEAMKLIPILRDSATVDAGQKAILELIAQKKAVLIDWPEVVSHVGAQGVTESIVEKRYQTEPQPPPPPNAVDGKFTAQSTFEVKNVGTTLQVETLLSPNGKSVNINMAPQRVAFLRMDDQVAFKPKAGPPIEIKGPVFTNSKVTTGITLRDGERCLVYTGKNPDPGTHIDFFIVGVKIIPAIK